jgi:hypothetical protein
VRSHPRVRAFDMNGIELEISAHGRAGFQMEAADRAHVADGEIAEVFGIVRKSNRDLRFVGDQAQP